MNGQVHLYQTTNPVKEGVMANFTSYEEVDAWVKEEQGKHFCACGCGTSIEVIHDHHWAGIPRWILAHRNWTVPFIDLDVWVAENQGKYFCECGCGEEINILKKYYHGKIPKRKRYHTYEAESVRFWKKVEKNDDDCWIWQGEKTTHGYGFFRLEGRKNTRKRIMAHRKAYMLTYGKFDDSLLVCHKCDNPPCVRPDHLFLGTDQDNNTDKMIKRRAAKALTEKDVLEIVKLVKSGKSMLSVSKLYGVVATSVANIMSGKNWAYLTGIMKRE